MLWLGNALPPSGGTGGDLPILRYFKFLMELGLELKFFAADARRAEPLLTPLKRLGIDILEGEWFRQNWAGWLKDHDQVIDFIYFDKPDLVTEFLPAVHRQSRAAVMYQCGPLRTDGKQAEAEQYALSNCDVLLVSSTAEKSLVRDRFPNKGVFRFISPESFVSAAESDKQGFQTNADQLNRILSAAKDEAVVRTARLIEDVSPQKPARLIAFYLPQYHPIPENDEWWGEGFTEWRNVKKTQPLFAGHYQPHVPADLGYYDLRHEGTRVAQAELARQYGIEGFCYYHYWFKGKRLLERPLNDLIKSGKPDFPFCLCWANESWSRRWDGKGQDILMHQEYSDQDDLEHIRFLIPLFKDPRYIRVNGKPLLLVYRSENIPDPARTAQLWREEVRKAGIGDLHLCRVESFVKGDPREFGFDASVEFAPDWWNKGAQLNADSDLLNGADRNLKQVCETNYIHSYQGLSEAMMAKEAPGYKWMRCVTPSWDNWARRNEDASVFLDSTPEQYRTWLASSIDNTNLRLHGEERIVFVNAWNEWAEGNHLEPDQKFGHAYLEATRQALKDGQVMQVVRRLGSADEKRMNRLTGQLANRENQISELQNQLNDVLDSTSWRVTVPLRWTKQRILDLKKLLSGQKNRE